jgi:hypothetical protein
MLCALHLLIFINKYFTLLENRFNTCKNPDENPELSNYLSIFKFFIKESAKPKVKELDPIFVNSKKEP